MNCKELPQFLGNKSQTFQHALIFFLCRVTVRKMPHCETKHMQVLGTRVWLPRISEVFQIPSIRVLHKRTNRVIYSLGSAAKSRSNRCCDERNWDLWAAFISLLNDLLGTQTFSDRTLQCHFHFSGKRGIHSMLSMFMGGEKCAFTIEAVWYNLPVREALFRPLPPPPPSMRLQQRADNLSPDCIVPPTPGIWIRLAAPTNRTKISRYSHGK